MTRNDARLLPFCKSCGEYKGLGSCKNPSCSGESLSDTDVLRAEKKKCSICGRQAFRFCTRCKKAYCSEHSIGNEETSLMKLNQHLGTCVICKQIICEYCWIFNEKGLITCQKHHSDLENEN